jgi:Rap1a immunity proteins
MSAFVQLSNNISGVNVEHDCSKGWGPGCWPELHVCFPKGATVAQILAVFLADARNHPADWHEPANVHYQNAMMAAFPCKGEFPKVQK